MQEFTSTEKLLLENLIQEIRHHHLTEDGDLEYMEFFVDPIMAKVGKIGIYGFGTDKEGVSKAIAWDTSIVLDYDLKKIMTHVVNGTIGHSVPEVLATLIRISDEL